MQASNMAFVTAAYVISWVVILGYLGYVQRSLKQARAEYVRVTGRPPEAANGS